jgi:hypothetical protein
MHMPPQTALVTGASGGLGLEFARRLAQDRFNLVLVARSKDKLEALADELRRAHGVAARVIAQDLALPNAPEEIYAVLHSDEVEVEVLVNNAGFASYGFFNELDKDWELAMVQVNVVALTHLTKLFLRGMVERGRGRILNMASTAAFQPGPMMAVYYATKAYVLSFSEALANELQGTGVTVTALCPGPTETGFQSRAQMEDSRLLTTGLMGAKQVVEIGYRGMLEGKTVVVPGLRNYLFSLAPRLVPRDMAARFVRRLQERVGR